VVFDSNIFVAALIFLERRTAAALYVILDGGDSMIISPAITEDVLCRLVDKFCRVCEELSQVALLLSELAAMFRPINPFAFLDDELDNHVLECAGAGKAEAVVTGDKAMLTLNSGIAILSLRDYLTRD